MSTEGVLCQVDTEHLASLVEKHCPRVKSAYADSWHVRYSTASPGQDTPRGQALVDKCQTSPCCTAREFGNSGWTRKGGLDDPPGEFAFGDCYLQLKQHMLQRSSFCVGDSGSVVEAALALGVPCELQLATIDTILVALQSDEFELDDETLCKLVAVLTTALPLPQFEYLIEAQVHSSIMLAEDIESLHLPAKYRIAPQAAGHIFRANLQAQRLCEKFGWRLCYY
ncbi:hypothetical protein WJX77_004814 [Trebouxia sp. C0004]